MKVKVREYKNIIQKCIMESPTELIKEWVEDIPEQRHADGYLSTFKAADYIGNKYPGRSFGIIIL